MSKDSSATYIHMHQPGLADLFEEFTRPHTSTAAISATTTTNQHHLNTGTGTAAQAGSGAGANAAAAVTYGSSATGPIPSYLPIEEVYVPPQHQPPNPEDEDDVVPDQHAAFGITRAMERRREAVWRDLGLEGLVNGQGHGGGSGAGTAASGAPGAGPDATRRGSGGGGGGAASSGSTAVRVRDAGRRMGGRRTVCLR